MREIVFKFNSQPHKSCDAVILILVNSFHKCSIIRNIGSFAVTVTANEAEIRNAFYWIKSHDANATISA